MRKSNQISCRMLIVVNLILWPIHTSFAYENTYTHPKINENAVKQSEFYLGGIIESLNFTTDEEKAKVVGWISKGGTDEDIPDRRAINHFHDPLKSWGLAGFYQLGYSALVWAQDQSAADNFPNQYSWAKAREHYYQALTTGTESEFAETFLALGHLMHLVSDMAVPAHVRQDYHVVDALLLPNDPDLYETYTASADVLSTLDFSGAKVDRAIFGLAITSGEAPAPVTALWDRDKYNGTNPSITLPGILPPMPGFLPIPVSGPMKVGLAEYANANFFSKDTIFKSYDNPSYWNTTPIGDDDWLNPETVPGEDGKPDKRVYVWGYAGGNGNIRLAGASLITRDSANAGYVSPPMVIDDNVSKDYASRLVPAAVGYSTALLDYFFRGDIDSSKTNPASGGWINFKEMC